VSFKSMRIQHVAFPTGVSSRPQKMVGGTPRYFATISFKRVCGCSFLHRCDLMGFTRCTTALEGHARYQRRGNTRADL
jgi:hypothetical protein